MHVFNGCTDFLVHIIELLRFYAKFEIDSNMLRLTLRANSYVQKELQKSFAFDKDDNIHK